MSSLARQRCYNHSQREAAARCPVCSGYFCRECVTEHDDRVICATCIKKTAAAGLVRRSRLLAVGRVVSCAAGITVAWFFFYWSGQQLLRQTSVTHKDALWKADWLD